MGTLTVPDTDGQSEREPRRDYEPGTQARGCKRQPHVPNTEVLRLTFASSVS